jgi:hypothetical protein
MSNYGIRGTFNELGFNFLKKCFGNIKTGNFAMSQALTKKAGRFNFVV